MDSPFEYMGLNKTGSRMCLRICVVLMLTQCLFSACNTKKYLQADELYLRRNTFTVTTPVLQNKVKNNITDQLSLLIPKNQRPNEYLGGLFPVRRWIYFKTDTKKDKGLRKWIGNQIAEKPVIFDSLQVNRQIADMRIFLEAEGYYKHNLSYEVRTSGRKANVYFIIDPGAPLTIDQFSVKTEDPEFVPYIGQIRETSNMKVGIGKKAEKIVLSQQLFDQEKQRITRFLRNKGYYDFVPSDIQPLTVDTSNGTNKVSLMIRPPIIGSRKPHTITEINLLQQYIAVLDDSLRVDTIMGNIHYAYQKDAVFLAPKVIADHLNIQPGTLYNLDNLERTVQLLDNLETFRFVSVQLLPDTTKPQSLKYTLLMPPAKLMSWTAGLDLNFSTITNVRSTVGGAFNTTFKHKNLFGGAEALQINTNIGLDFVLRQQFQSSADVRNEIQLKVPRLQDLQRIWRLMASSKLINSNFAKDLKQRGITNYNLGYNYQRQLSLFGFHSFNGSYGVGLKQNRTSYNIQQTAMSLFLPIELPGTDSFLANQEFLRRSLSPQLITGLLFHSLTVNHYYPSTRGNDPLKLVLRFEQSGLEVRRLLSLYKTISGAANEPVLFKDVTFAQYIRFEGDISQTLKIAGNRAIALRASTGVAYSLKKDESVPYLRQFFVGGPYSIRAWRIRGLGPGEHIDPVSNDVRSQRPAFQTGDVKMEFNFEYRFPLFWQLESALFLDGGNIWTLRKDQDRPNGVISTDFYKQIAIGGGTGLRFDASFVLIRFDVAYPFRQPYSDELGRHWEQPVNFVFKKLNYNLAIGYPF